MRGVTVRKIQEPECHLYDTHGTFVDTIVSSLQLLDVCVQIKEKSISGYYVVYDNERINISAQGNVDRQPYGFYDQLGDMLRKLL